MGAFPHLHDLAAFPSIDRPHGPFLRPAALALLACYLGDRVQLLTFEDGSGAALFTCATPYGPMVYSFGRWGTAGIWGMESLGAEALADRLAVIAAVVRERIAPEALSLSLGLLPVGVQESPALAEGFALAAQRLGGSCRGRINHVTRLHRWHAPGELLDLRGGNPLLPGRSRRANLTRNIRKAEQAGLQTALESGWEVLTAWQALHQQRCAELGGAYWPLPFLACAHACEGLEMVLFTARRAGELVGGILCFHSPQVLDVFMPAATAATQKMGGNHLLAEQLLLWSQRQGIAEVNWQGSNPPDGGVARFKEQWLGEPRERLEWFLPLQPDRLAGVDWPALATARPDRFLFPFPAPSPSDG